MDDQLNDKPRKKKGKTVAVVPEQPSQMQRLLKLLTDGGEVDLYQHLGTIDVGDLGSVVWFGGEDVSGEPALCEIVRRAPLVKKSTLANWHCKVQITPNEN